MFKFMIFVFPNNCYMWWRPAVLEMIEELLMRNLKLIISFALLVWMAFALHIKLSLSQPISFLNFSLWIFFLIPPRGGGRGGEKTEHLCDTLPTGDTTFMHGKSIYLFICDQINKVVNWELFSTRFCLWISYCSFWEKKKSSFISSSDFTFHIAQIHPANQADNCHLNYTFTLISGILLRS